jgi:hypothetical protein
VQRLDLLPGGEEGRGSRVSNAAAARGQEGERAGAYLALPVESWTLARIRLSSSAWSSEASARLSSGWRQCCCCCLGSDPQAGKSREMYCESGGVGVGGGPPCASPGPAPSRKLPAMGRGGGGAGLGLAGLPPRRLIARGAAHRMLRRGRLEARLGGGIARRREGAAAGGRGEEAQVVGGVADVGAGLVRSKRGWEEEGETEGDAGTGRAGQAHKREEESRRGIWSQLFAATLVNGACDWPNLVM